MTDKLIGQGIYACMANYILKIAFILILDVLINDFSTGEFGIIYKAQLISWLWYQKNMPVAVKRLKGIDG